MAGYSPPPTPDPLNTILNSGTLGTIQSPIVIGTILNSPSVTTQISTIEAIGTIENAPLVTVQGAVSASLEYAATIGTIENAPLITVQGTVTVGTIENAPLVTVQGSTSASVEYPVTVATIDNAPLITAQGAISASVEYPVTVATIDNAPLVTIQGTATASIEYPVTVGTIENAPLVTAQGSVTASISNIQPSIAGNTVGTVFAVTSTLAVQLGSSTVLNKAVTVRNYPSTAPSAVEPAMLIGDASFQWFYLEAGAALTLENAVPANIYALAETGSGTMMVIYSGQ